LKRRFAAELTEREAHHRAEMEALRQSAAADLTARDRQHAAQLRGFQQSLAAEIKARDEHWVGQINKLQQSYAADVAARNEQQAAQVRTFEQSLDELQDLLTATSRTRDDEAQDRAAAETELQARRAQLAAQHLELETHRADLARLGAQVAELTQALAAEHQSAVQWNDRAQRLEATLRDFAGRAHDATREAAAVVADAHDAAVKRGDDIAEQVVFHEAAVNQLRATIEQQRAAYERVMEERQAARTRCTELESQLHALTSDARHLAEGLQRAQAERDAERQEREERDGVPPPVTRLRLAGTADSA
jgi:chromosome segregation ATPase